MFNKTNEQFTEATSNTVDTTYELLNASIDSIEKLAQIQLETSRKIIDETSQAIKELSSCTSSKDVFSKVNQFANNTVENNLCNCKDAYEVLTDTQSKLSKIFENYFQTAQQQISETVDNLAKFNPTKTNLMSDSLKTFTTGATQAFDAFNKAASQVAEYANKNIIAATNTVKPAAKKSSSSNSTK